MTITHDGGREHEAPHHQFLTKVEADAEKAEAWMTDYYRVAPFKAHHRELFATWFGFRRRPRLLSGTDGAVPHVPGRHHG